MLLYNFFLQSYKKSLSKGVNILLGHPVYYFFQCVFIYLFHQNFSLSVKIPECRWYKYPYCLPAWPWYHQLLLVSLLNCARNLVPNIGDFIGVAMRWTTTHFVAWFSGVLIYLEVWSRRPHYIWCSTCKVHEKKKIKQFSEMTNLWLILPPNNNIVEKQGPRNTKWKIQFYPDKVFEKKKEKEKGKKIGKEKAKKKTHQKSNFWTIKCTCQNKWAWQLNLRHSIFFLALAQCRRWFTCCVTYKICLRL